MMESGYVHNQSQHGGPDTIHAECRDEVERLRAERDREQQRAERLGAEADDYRAALQDIANYRNNDAQLRALFIARRALEGSSDERS